CGAVERLGGDAKDRAGEAPVELAERLAGAAGNLVHQLRVAGGILRRRHARSSWCVQTFHERPPFVTTPPAPLRIGSIRRAIRAAGGGVVAIERRSQMIRKTWTWLLTPPLEAPP